MEEVGAGLSPKGSLRMEKGMRAAGRRGMSKGPGADAVPKGTDVAGRRGRRRGAGMSDTRRSGCCIINE